MGLPKGTRRGHILKNSIAFLSVFVSVSCLLILTLAVIRLPDASPGNRRIGFPRNFKIRQVSEDERLGGFGEMMVQMLPDDLAFTVFVPSENAFQRDLRLQVNESLGAEKMNDTFAVISRILGFSAVPRPLFSVSIPSGKEISFDSLSGFGLYIWKDSVGRLLVNGVRSERVDLRKKEIVVHVMDGVIMDSEFELSFQPEEG